MKKCPSCGGDIQEAAIRCKHCKLDIPAQGGQLLAEAAESHVAPPTATELESPPHSFEETAKGPSGTPALGDASVGGATNQQSVQQVRPGGSAASKGLFGGIASLGVLVFLAWIVGRNYFECGIGVPTISIQAGYCEGLSFGDWVWDSVTLKTKMTYKGGYGCGKIGYAAYDSHGVKLEQGHCSHPSLTTGESGELRCCCPDRRKTAKVILTIESE